MVGGIVSEDILNGRTDAFGNHNLDFAFVASERHTTIKDRLADQGIQRAGEFSRIEVDDLTAALKMINLLNHGEGDDECCAPGTAVYRWDRAG